MNARALGADTDVRTRERFLRVALLGAGLTLLGAISAGKSGAAGARALLALAPLVPVVIGLYALRVGKKADGWLLFAVPSSLALTGVPSVLPSGEPGARLDPIFFCTWAVVLVGYVAQAARLLAPPAPSPHVVREGQRAERAERLHWRMRFYDAMAALCAIAFAYLLGRALTSGAAPLPAMATAGLLAVLTARAFLVDTLDRHLRRDPSLVQTLDRLRRHARRGRPERSFYIVAFVALAAMALFILRERLP